MTNLVPASKPHPETIKEIRVCSLPKGCVIDGVDLYALRVHNPTDEPMAVKHVNGTTYLINPGETEDIPVL